MIRAPKGKFAAGVTGAGSGTLVIALVNQAPAEWRPIMTYAAPWVAVIVSAFWAFAYSILAAWLDDIRVARELRMAEEVYATIQRDPNTSDKLMKDAKNKVEELRLLQLASHFVRAKEMLRQ